MVGSIVNPAGTLSMSMSRSKVIWIVVSTGTEDAPLSGTTAVTPGAPIVVKVRSWPLPWTLPARSSTPGAM